MLTVHDSGIDIFKPPCPVRALGIFPLRIPEAWMSSCTYLGNVRARPEGKVLLFNHLISTLNAKRAVVIQLRLHLSPISLVTLLQKKPSYCVLGQSITNARVTWFLSWLCLIWLGWPFSYCYSEGNGGRSDTLVPKRNTDTLPRHPQVSPMGPCARQRHCLFNGRRPEETSLSRLAPRAARQDPPKNIDGQFS